MADFEEKYRRKVAGGELAAIVAGPARTAPDKEPYQAFNASPQAQFDLWVRTSSANENTDTSLPYSRRNHMITDGGGFLISQHFDTPVISVMVQGRNLQELFRKLLRHEVEWIMEFDPRLWPTPPDDAPCITAIQIKRKPLQEEKGDNVNSGDEMSPAKPLAH